ncbi:MAG: hypothetical protein ACXVFT_13215 [Solirubrobacteraceae bacterium]
MSADPKKLLTRPAALLLGAALALGVTGAAGAASRRAPSATPPPSQFTTRVDNPWVPLRPGTTLVYEGVKDGKPSRDVYRVLHQTRTIAGVRCVVVDDRLYEAGKLEERTRDYYVQDKGGTVWYFGEDTAELDRHGKVTSTEGTWHAGVDGARAGIFMPAHPRIGEQHRQEYYRGHAEDKFRVFSLHASVKVPYGSFRGALSTREFTRLEPGALDGKVYVRGIGEVLESTIKGPKERSALVSIHRG